MLLTEPVTRVLSLLAALLAAPIMVLAVHPPGVQVSGASAARRLAVMVDAEQGCLGRVFGVSGDLVAARQQTRMEFAARASCCIVRSHLPAVGGCTAVLAAEEALVTLLVGAIVDLACVLEAVIIAFRATCSLRLAFLDPTLVVATERETRDGGGRAPGGFAAMCRTVARGVFV